METKEMRPYLKRNAEDELEVIWRPYSGPTPLWIFEHFNKCVTYRDRNERMKGDSPYDFMECYQEAMNEQSLEEIFLQAASGKTPKGENIRDPKAYITMSIGHLFSAYYRKKNKAKKYVSLDIEKHGNIAFTTDTNYDEQDRDSSTVLDRTMAKLTNHERKLFTNFMINGTRKDAASNMKIAEMTYSDHFEDARWSFLGKLGLEKVRALIHDETVLKLLDALIASKGDIPSAAKILHMTRNDCRDAFKVSLLPALLKACGGYKRLLELCY